MSETATREPGTADEDAAIARRNEEVFPARASREQLMAMLGEASEVEHDLMCCYLYAAFGMKRGEDEGLTGEQAEAVGRWRRAIIGVAVEEMGHLALVSNLLSAIGGTPNFSRLNFPIGAGALPAAMTVRLSPFDMDTLDHFIWLERPEGSDVADAGRFANDSDYVRGPVEQNALMPVARDYATVGEFYDRIGRFVDVLNDKYGPEGLFVGDPARQVGPEITPLPGLIRVSNLDEAKRALDTIVEQGEGAPSDRDDSHYARFRAIRREYEALLEDDPGFVPSRPVAENPVMRRPPTPEGKVWITDADAATVADFANALYVHMLRLLAQAFGRPGDAREKRVFVNAATDLMHALTEAAEALTRLPANDEDGANAGLSFAMTWSTAALPTDSDLEVLGTRFDEIVEVARRLRGRGLGLERAVETIEHVARAFDRERRALAESVARAASEAPDGPVGTTGEGAAVRGTHGVLSFDTGRCIHARFCVTGAPKVFLSGVEGQWLYPDEADPDELVAITERCPSGAIRFVRTDGGRDEAVPPVNLVRVRENGPLAFHASLAVDGRRDGYRRTLCRCGRSGAKPYCDGSHVDGFEASGEPATRGVDALPVRDGPLDVHPLPDGPLQVSGSLETNAGTGRAVARTRTVKLCRCGASGSKPFCDGSHVRVGFRSEG